MVNVFIAKLDLKFYFKVLTKIFNNSYLMHDKFIYFNLKFYCTYSTCKNKNNYLTFLANTIYDMMFVHDVTKKRRAYIIWLINSDYIKSVKIILNNN